MTEEQADKWMNEVNSLMHQIQAKSILSLSMGGVPETSSGRGVIAHLSSENRLFLIGRIRSFKEFLDTVEDELINTWRK